MEALRPRTTSTVDRNLTSEKFTIGFIRVIDLFRGIKVPNNEPVPQPRTRLPTTNPHEKLAPPLCINGHRALPLSKAVYALPSMVVPDEHVEVWENVIRERLVDELRLHFRSQKCQPEFLMVSDASSKIGPCICLSVWDDSLCNTEEGRKKTIKDANKIVRKLQTMQQCPFPFKVIADKISLATRSSGRSKCSVESLEGPLLERSSLVGLELSGGADERVSFRLGGLVRVGSKIYGLTVAHPFIRRQQQYLRPAAIVQDTREPYDSDSTDSDCEEDKLFRSQHPTIAAEVAMNQQEVVHTFQDETNPTFQPLQPDSDRLATSAHSSSSNVSTTSFGEVYTYSNWSSKSDVTGDWALVELQDDVPVLPNLYKAQRDGSVVQIDGISTNGLQPQTAVTILTGSNHLLHGVLGQSNVKISVDGLNLTVTQIILQRPLAPGYSGSWVVKDDLFVGCLVAVRSFLPIAYMVPASSVIQEIGESLNSTDVGLDVLNASAEEPSGPSHHTREQVIDVDLSGSTESVQHSPRPDLDLRSLEIPQSPPEVASGKYGDLYNNATEIPRPKDLESDVDEHSRLLSTSVEEASRWELPKPGSSSKRLRAGTYRSSWMLMKYLAATYPPAFLALLAAIMPAAILDEISTSLVNTSELRSQLILSSYILGQGFGLLIATPLTNAYGQWRPALLFVCVSAVFNLASGFSKTSTQLIWFRLLSGIGASGSAALLTIPISLSTMGQRKVIGALCGFSLSLAFGLGPWFGAMVAQRLSWAWSFWILAAMLLLQALLLIVVCGRSLVHNDDPFKDADDDLAKQKTSAVRVFAVDGIEIFQMLRDPILALLIAWRSLCAGTLYFILSSLAGLLQEKYALSLPSFGAWYLALGGGVGLCRFLIRTSPVWEPDSIASEDDQAERWLVMSTPSSVLILAGLTLYGWSAEKCTSVALTAVGLVVFSIGHGAISEFATRYTVDVYRMKALPVLRAMNFAMDLAGFGFPLFAPAFVRRCGYGWSSTILALSGSCVYLFVVLVLRTFGLEIRTRRRNIAERWVSKTKARKTSRASLSSAQDVDDGSVADSWDSISHIRATRPSLSSPQDFDDDDDDDDDYDDDPR
ncbi:hypothetical protein PV08_04647 [Exophiala spinifera]|uniref:Major facilitator superfamily (MFS) profile domain-containing protein n=1 Tax=Exophiala spinifera TaxID=91928 RepID=A0A0D2BER1_9EURO|nr:uncharacterized protein PV08_04647 [Exophiala spinifera]KIW17453.1 hypothetical protein PV08_04647 [Exophiala spinifera]